MMPDAGDVVQFILEGCEERVIVFDGNLKPVYRNPGAGRFLRHYSLPDEVTSLAGSILATIAAREDLAAKFPGRIIVFKEIGERRWVFRFRFRDAPAPLVSVHFIDMTVSDRFDLNAVRRQHGLTRREVDVLRHLLDGLSNLEIADELGVAEQTIKEYVSSIYEKTGVKGRFSLLRHFVSAPQC